jgi:protein AroM
MSKRIALLTIGQTPRTDLVPDLVRWIPDSAGVDEVGALDGLDPEEIAALAPEPGDRRLVTRLRGGRQAVIRKGWAAARLQQILDNLRADHYDAVVLLCTGEFPDLRAPGLFLDAQQLVDHGAAALCHRAGRVGIVLPLAEQAADLSFGTRGGQETVVTYASPYEGDRLAQAGRELAHADVVVMHCIGYTEAHRDAVAVAAGRPVLLARRLVAAALAQVV